MAELNGPVILIASALPAVTITYAYANAWWRERQLRKVKNKLIRSAYELAGMLITVQEGGYLDDSPFVKRQVRLALTNFAKLDQDRKKILEMAK